MLLYSEHSHKDMLYRLAITLTKKKQASLLFLVLCLNSSSFRPWVPDLNLKKKIEPMSETPYFLHSKSSFNSLYTLSILFLHIKECNLQTCTYNKFLTEMHYLYKIQLLYIIEPSEVEVKSISLIISKTHFFHCFLFLL